MSKIKINYTMSKPLFCLFLVFFILKITEVITWSWWWITAPLWIPAGLGLFFVLIWLILYIVLG